MAALLKKWYGPLARGRVWKESVHLLADLVVGIGLFTAVVTMLSLSVGPASYTHLRAHETVLDTVGRLLLEKNNTKVVPGGIHQITVK